MRLRLRAGRPAPQRFQGRRRLGGPRASGRPFPGPVPLRGVPAALGASALLGLAAFGLLPRIIPWSGEDEIAALRWSTVILDRRDEIIQVRPVNDEGLRRIFVPYDALPREFRRIVRISEDRRFFLHPGVDVFAFTKAGFRFLTRREGGGGSTISMQLIRILEPRPEGMKITPRLKLREAWKALQLESRLSKREILELYINAVPFGNNIEGFPAAARLWFGRNLEDLRPEELCILAVIPRSPSRLDPLKNPRTREANRRAAEELANRSLRGRGLRGEPRKGSQGGHRGGRPGNSGGYIEYTQYINRYTQYTKYTGDFSAAYSRLGDSAVAWPFEAPHFAEHVLAVRAGQAGRGRQPHQNREPLRTTLDLQIQREAAAMVKHHTELAESFRISSAAMILADPAAMEVRAWVGSADFHDEENSGQIDGVTMRREPGSTLKPLLYASALDSGWTAAAVLPDIPTDFGSEFIYAPANYNEQFHGPVRLRQALAASLNIPAVYTLERLGVKPFTEKLIQAGFKSLLNQKDDLGVSLALGGAEVSLAELVQSYGVLHRGGVLKELQVIRPRDSDKPPTGPASAPAPVAAPGSNEAAARAEARLRAPRVWTPESAEIITNIISSPNDRTLTFGRRGPVRFNYPVAMKTGTSNQFNNIWAVGFTSNLIGGVWMGSFDGTTVMGAPGSSRPAALLHEAFDRWSDQKPLPRNAELTTARICAVSGMKAAPLCPYTLGEFFAPGSEPPECTWHRPDPLRGVVVRYPQEYAAWARRYGYSLQFGDYVRGSRGARRGGRGDKTAPAILNPPNGAVYYREPNRDSTIHIRLAGTGPAVLESSRGLLWEGRLPADIPWTLEPGITTFTLIRNDRRDSRRIEVR